jgi:hypothetical protein
VPKPIPKIDIEPIPKKQEPNSEDEQYEDTYKQKPKQKEEPGHGKFIEEVYYPQDLKKAKDSKNYGNIKIDNIFEQDTINIPVYQDQKRPVQRPQNPPKQPRQQEPYNFPAYKDQPAYQQPMP